VSVVAKSRRESNPDAGRELIASIARAFAILRSFRRGERALGNKEIAERTGLPRSSVARITATLTRLGYLEYLAAREKYALGVGVLGLGQNYLAGLDVREVARPLMQELAHDSRGTVALAARDGDQMVFLEICHGNQAFGLRLGVGERVPRGSTALGRAAHAALPEAERARVTEAVKKSRDSRRDAVLKGLEQGVKDYQRHGFCLSLGDWDRNVHAVGVPMASTDGGKVLAFSCFGTANEMTRARLLGEVGPRLVELRDRVRLSLGGF
jgi:DNA-binding IclR family transcriptional regulator